MDAYGDAYGGRFPPRNPYASPYASTEMDRGTGGRQKACQPLQERGLDSYTPKMIASCDHV